jgi:TolB-like protein/cytochrome c-type biogenesis protein CcmH/NrfG
MAEAAGEGQPTGTASTEPGARPSTPPVFVSYASQDAAVVNPVVEALERQGLKCWIAPRDVIAGEFYGDAIVRAIDAAQVLVLLLSKSAAASPHILREVERASSKFHPVISLRIDRAPLPAGLEYFLNTSQWLDASDGEPSRAFPKLVDAVRNALTGAVASSTPSTSADASALPKPAPRSRTRHRATAVAAAVIVAALAFVAVDKFWLSKHVAAEQPATTAASTALNTTPAATAISDKSVAVLPFLDMSEKKDQEYFSDGLSEELIDMLTKVPDLRVPARTSSFYFKGKSEDIPTIAKRLMVANVLEGSVRKSGDHLRVTAQLVRADNGYHLWSETYDRQLDDIFKVQDEIATAVVGALKLKLLAEPTASDRHTTIPEAHNQYLIGRHLLSGSNWAVDRSAAEAFKRAVELDPKYAPAWAGLAEATYNASQVAASIPEYNAMGQEALTAADKAIALRPDLPDGYVARGFVRAWNQFDFQGADQDLRRALALEPENPDVLSMYASSVLMPSGRLDEAVAAAQKALKVDPLNADTWRRLGVDQYFRGDYHAAREALQRALEINPQQSNTAAFLGFTFLVTGDPASALPLSQRATIELFRQQGAALAEHDLGHATVAQQSLHEMIAKDADGGAYQIAEVFAWWGDKDKGIEWLERAYVQHDGGLAGVKVDPLLRRLRPDPRYQAFLRKMNLPE